MKPNPSVRPSRVIPIFSRVFPHKLTYQSFSKKLGFPNLPIAQQHQHNEIRGGVRRYSTRPRLGTGSEAKASKSLIEDEAELSDWVNELRSNSSKTRLYSDTDNDNDNRNGDSGRVRSGNRHRGGDERRGKRRRESDSDDLTVSNGRKGTRDSFPVMGTRDSFSGRGTRDSFSGRGTRDSFPGRETRDSFPGNSRGKGKFGGHGENEKDGLRRRGNGLNYSNDFGAPSKQNGSDRFSGNPRNKGKFSGEFGGNKDGFMMRDTEKKRGLGNGINRAGGGTVGGLRKGGKNLGRTGLVMSDEDNEDDDEEVIGRFRDLISDEESEEEEEVKEDDDDDVFKKSPLTRSRSDIGDSLPVSPKNSPGRNDSYLSETRFDQCAISSLSLKGIKDAGYEKMTVVQEATLPIILKGKDVLAKAKTGTGKTVAFLLPSIEVVVKSPPVDRDQKRPPILVLVICPTRELASQAAAEANTLLKYHPSFGVQVVIGGTRLALEQKRMQANPCQILVATPGRLKDHIENTPGFATRLMGVKVLVLDEADHLLDMGFRKDIEKIIAAVPKQRQTLLFSATVPQEVRQICHIALKRDHEYINTVLEGSEETHSQVKQMHLVAPLDKQFSLLYVLLKEHIADDVDYKVLVFCTTAMVTRLVADLLGELNLNVREIHSRKPQSYRTKISDEFRKSKGLILVTSDVSARGVDYPDVTLVIQVGLPADKQQYIHRLGRTGRKGKEGQGILLLAPWEEFFLSTIKDLPITKAPVPLVDPDTTKRVERALSHVEMKNKESAYQAWLGYYNSNKTVGRDKFKLVELANEFSRSMGLDNPPAIPKLVLGKMGLRNVPGLRSK
ncbi:unnamed protein product [Ilex paraguariensis]|uniref:ATP-dependent RNA helicase n=1 Tax=Ilex paraguariensis TaxID=185542 RepID=A0ABC8RAC3_9AQUA